MTEYQEERGDQEQEEVEAHRIPRPHSEDDAEVEGHRIPRPRSDDTDVDDGEGRIPRP